MIRKSPVSYSPIVTTELHFERSSYRNLPENLSHTTCHGGKNWGTVMNKTQPNHPASGLLIGKTHAVNTYNTM